MPTHAARDASNDATNYIFFDDRDALVLSGGGARGAYQVGVLKAIAEWLPEDAPCPFEVLVGTSAGALNAAAIGARAHSLREAVQSLEEVWSNFRVEQVVRASSLTMLKSGLHWMVSLLSAGWIATPPRSLFDTTPLHELLARAVPLEQIPAQIAAGRLHALAVATTSYTTGQAVAFFDGTDEIEAWNRVQPCGPSAPDRSRRADGERGDPVHLPGVGHRRRITTATVRCASSHP